MDKIIIVRGGGDIATGTIVRLKKCGFKLIVLESEKPSAIRRLVSLSEAIYKGRYTVDGVTAVFAKNELDCIQILENGDVPIIVDENMDILSRIEPFAIVDATIAKKNLGLKKDMAKLVIALGPGFNAGVDCHFVIETDRGHDLGIIIEDGFAKKNTGIPGEIKGVSMDRVIHSENAGTFRQKAQIKDIVKKGDVIGYVDDTEVHAKIDGVLRGLIHDGYHVHDKMKIADIDPRISEQKNCDTISDKARCLSGSVLELVVRYYKRR